MATTARGLEAASRGGEMAPTTTSTSPAHPMPLRLLAGRPRGRQWSGRAPAQGSMGGEEQGLYELRRREQFSPGHGSDPTAAAPPISRALAKNQVPPSLVISVPFAKLLDILLFVVRLRFVRDATS